MAIQLILCMETNKRSRTDYVYITSTINEYYICDRSVKVSPIFMGSKSRYQHKDTLREIKEYIRDYKNGKSVVIYCIDTDMYENNIEHVNDFEKVSMYCKEKNYDLIWFCHDVEEVYIGKSISDKEKVKMATEFKVQNKVIDVNSKKLMCNTFKKCSSNIMIILDKYLVRKNS